MKLVELSAGWAMVVATFLAELVKSTIVVVRAVLGAPHALRPRVVAVPLDVRSASGITLFANMVSLTPGTTSLTLSPDGRHLYVHCLDAPDEAATVRGMKQTLERRARRVLP